MPNTLDKEAKIKDLIANWDKYKKLSSQEVASIIGVSDRTIYSWRMKLKTKGINLEYEIKDTSDDDIFNKFAK